MMERVIQFYGFFGFPIILKVNPSKSSKLFIAWCWVSLIWFFYHYAHLWGPHYANRIYTFFVTPTAAEFPNMAAALLHVCIEFCITAALKVYLLASYIRRDASSASLYSTIGQLNNVYSLFNPSFRILTVCINCVLFGLLVVTSGLVYFAVNVLRWCLQSDDQCLFSHFTPGIDFVGDIFNAFSLSMGNTFLPLLASVACLQFAASTQSTASKLSINEFGINHELIRHLVGHFDAHVAFIRHLDGWLFVLISLYTIDMITAVSRVALQITRAAAFSVFFVSLEFSCIALLCYSSSRAVEAVSHQLTESICMTYMIFIANRKSDLSMNSCGFE